MMIFCCYPLCRGEMTLPLRRTRPSLRRSTTGLSQATPRLFLVLKPINLKVHFWRRFYDLNGSRHFVTVHSRKLKMNKGNKIYDLFFFPFFFLYSFSMIYVVKFCIRCNALANCRNQMYVYIYTSKEN